MAKESKVKQPFAFVVMSFPDEFMDVYQKLIKQSCERAGIRCERVDEQAFDDSIVEQIHQNIRTADIIIADLTGANANVYYEVGYAKAHEKRVVALTQDFDDLRFDFRSFNVFKYERSRLASHVDDLAQIMRDRIQIPPKGFDILGVYDKSADLQTIIGEFLVEVDHTVIFSGAHFAISASDRRQELLELLKNGVQIKYHVIDPATEAVGLTASAYGMRESELQGECETGIKVLEGLVQDAKSLGCRGTVEVYLSSEQPQARYMLFDHESDTGRIIVTPYVDRLRSSHSPSYAFRSGASFAKTYTTCCLSAVERSTHLNFE